MVERTACGLTDSLIKEGLISKELGEWYTYSFIRIIESAISMGTILFLSILLNNTVQTILFLIFFNMLRRRTGGFHCSEFWQCYIISNLMYLLIVIGEPYVRQKETTEWLMTVLSAVWIIYVGTVNHPNVLYNTQELLRSKNLSRGILMVELIFIVSMSAIGIARVYVSYMSMGIILCAVLILFAKVFRQEVKDCENTKNTKKSIA